MANRTVKDASTVKGTNPQYLVEKIIRTRVYDSRFWKEECFALSAELIVDKGMELRYLGGVYAGNVKPTPFLCLILKMLQIQPERDIVVEFIRQEEYKYIRALGAVYLRLTFGSVEIYKYLEPLYNDYRKLRFMNKDGRFELLYMDDLIDHLLHDESYCNIHLPRLQKRQALEEVGELEPYVSALEGDIGKLSSDEEEEEKEVKKKERPKLVSRRRRSRSQDRELEKFSRRDERVHVPWDQRKRSRSPERKSTTRRADETSTRSSTSSKKTSTSKDDEKREVAEANALRAKLGMAPLQR